MMTKKISIAIEHISVCGHPLLSLLARSEILAKVKLDEVFVEIDGVTAEMDEMATAVIRTHANYMTVRAVNERLYIQQEQGRYMTPERVAVTCPHCHKGARVRHYHEPAYPHRCTSNTCENCGRNLLVGRDSQGKLTVYGDGTNKLIYRWHDVAATHLMKLTLPWPSEDDADDSEEDWVPCWRRMSEAPDEEMVVNRIPGQPYCINGKGEVTRAASSGSIVGIAAEDLNRGEVVEVLLSGSDSIPNVRRLPPAERQNKRLFGTNATITMCNTPTREPGRFDHMMDAIRYAPIQCCATGLPEISRRRVRTRHTTCPLCDTPDSVKSKRHRFCSECGLKLPHKHWFELCARRDGETYMIKKGK